MAVALALFTSVFWGIPVDLRSLLGVKPPPSRVVSTIPPHGPEDVIPTTTPTNPDHHNRDEGHETKADGLERRGDWMEVRSIRAEACRNIQGCVPDPSTDFYDDHIMAVGLWAQAINSTDNPTMKNRLMEKVRENVGITCPAQQAGPCFANETNFRTSLESPVQSVELGHHIVLRIGK